MSTADELFMGVNPEEPHIVVREDRTIIVPDDLKTIIVQHDHNIETITFDCPRYWDGHDLSTMDIKINYKLSNGFKGAYTCLDVVVDTEDDNMMHFTWTISNIVTQTSGAIAFLICATTLNVDGTADQAWHTKPCSDLSVAEGMDCIGVEDVEPDPAFLDTKENVANKVQEINAGNTAVQYPSAKAVYDYAVAKRHMLNAIEFDANENQFYSAQAINDTLITLSEMMTGLEERIGKLENA